LLASRLPGSIRQVVRRILIVDDNPRFRAVATELLAHHGYEDIMTAADGDQALAAAADGCPDGILLDINLPGADGFTVAESLAAVCPGVRIVLTSAAVDHVSAQILGRSAAVAFVPKEQLAVTDLGLLFAT
jgi:CheY-like chemotaxis protein